jgi:phosphate transport system substrate-binding protein
MEPEWTRVAVARDGIAVIVHPDNPVEGLGLLQLRDLFGGRAYDWKILSEARSLGPVQPVSREKGSGTRAAFESQVMEDLPVTPQAVVVPSSRAVVEYVANHPRAIGYVSMALVPEDGRAHGVKVLEIEGILPTPQSAAQGSYPLSRELWLVTGSPPGQEVQDFFDFALGPAGQQIVAARYGRIR